MTTAPLPSERYRRVTLGLCGLWLVTVAVAMALERAGRAGPAEWAIRRLAYGRPAAGPAAPAQPVSAG